MQVKGKIKLSVVQMTLVSIVDSYFYMCLYRYSVIFRIPMHYTQLIIIYSRSITVKTTGAGYLLLLKLNIVQCIMYLYL